MVCRDAVLGRVIAGAVQPWMFETVVCSTLQESQELVQKKHFGVIFSEALCADGTYKDLLATALTQKVPFVVVVTDASHDFVFQEAMASGAFDVLAASCSRKDVQWMVIRATRKRLPARGSFRSRGF